MQGYFLTVTGDWVGCSSLEIFEKNPELQKGEGAFLQAGLRVHDYFRGIFFLGVLAALFPGPLTIPERCQTMCQ